MSIKFIVTNNIPTLDIKWGIKKSLIQSTLLVHWKAVNNAPFLSWNLRRSLHFKVKGDTGKVWTNVKYARVREYINKKNPSKIFYMKRAIESSYHKIEQIFRKNINNVLNNK